MYILTCVVYIEPLISVSHIYKKKKWDSNGFLVWQMLQSIVKSQISFMLNI